MLDDLEHLGTIVDGLDPPSAPREADQGSDPEHVHDGHRADGPSVSD
ncbi:hypothetical protein ACVOMT_15955 [Sphingomonas panni]